MKEILKNGRDIILKMCVTQIGFAMFGLFFSMLAKNLTDSTGLLAGLSIATTAVYLFIIFIHVWEHGAKERIKVDGNRLKKNIYTGLILSLVANSINIILAVLVNISYYSLDGVGIVPLDQISTPEWATEMFMVSNAAARLIQAMYLGLIRAYFNEWTPIFFIIVLPALAVSFTGYYLGFSNKAVAIQKLFMQKKK